LYRPKHVARIIKTSHTVVVSDGFLTAVIVRATGCITPQYKFFKMFNEAKLPLFGTRCNPYAP
jgi:hypothetical protein